MKSLEMKGRQTRHSKVYTSRGPRDRRVRLSAVTAIQFYDVQDRLGFDRPSEAVDWLMLKAKAAIEALNHKPNVFDGLNIARESCDEEKLRNVQLFGCDSVSNSASFPDHIHMPEFNYDAVEPFPLMGSQESVILQEQTRQECEFVPSSCLDQVVFSASLFSKQTSPGKRTVFSSGLASSMEDAPRKHRVLDWPFMTPSSIEFRSSFQIGE